jgi:trigger factor
LDVTTEIIGPREVEFTIHPEAEQVEEARRKAARKAAQHVRIPGFRPGKAPYVLVERTVGREILTEEAAGILAPDLYKRVLEESGYEPFDSPAVRIAQQEPLELKIRVSLQPTVELPDYCAMTVEPEPEVEVTPEQEEKLLNDVREQHGTWVPMERPAAMGDQVTLDFMGVADGETLFDEQGTELTLAESLSPPGLAEEIFGMELGQTREFVLTYPENYAQERVAGKTVAVTATLRGVKERRLPELDDEFAQSLGEYAALDDLKARLREGLKAQLEAEARSRLATRVLDQVVAQATLEYPNLAVEQQIDRLIRQRESRLRQQGFTLETYLRVIHKSVEQLRDELRSEAEEALRRSLVLRKVGRAERIEVKQAEVMAEVNRVASAYGEQAAAVRQALMQEGTIDALVGDMYERQAMARLVDVVTGQAEGVCAPPELPQEERAALAASEPPAAGETGEQLPVE